MELPNTIRLDLLVHWIKERRLIREKRLRGDPWPWTEDSILLNYRFTNVEREHDRVTEWLRDNWRDPYRDHPNLTAAMVLARLINEPKTLEAVGFPVEWSSYDIKVPIRAIKDQGDRWLNPAYVVTTCGQKMDKIDYIVDLATEVKDHEVRPIMGDTLEYFHKKLMQFNGLGNFLAAQVIADLKNTPCNPLRGARDFMSWAAVGPGSIRGLRAVLGRPDIAERHFLALTTKLKAQVEETMGEPLNICMQDFQNVLCEFSKYYRAYAGTGQPKQRFNAHR